MAAPVSSFEFVQDLRLFYENLIDDSPDQDFTYQQLSISKNRIESMYKPQILQVTDISQVANPGDTYLSMKALPDNYRQMLKLFVGNLQYFPCPFGSRITYRNNGRRFYIDLKNKQFALCGTVASQQPIAQTYLIQTDDLVLANEATTLLSDVLVWPIEFAPIIAYEAAGFYQVGVDADSIAENMGTAKVQQAQLLLDAFISWNAGAQLSDINGQLGYADDVGADDIDPYYWVGAQGV